MTQRKQPPKQERQPTPNEESSEQAPAENPLLKTKVNVSFQVNLGFFDQMEAIKEDSGFESISELCRTALRPFIRKEARANKMIQTYTQRRLPNTK